MTPAELAALASFQDGTARAVGIALRGRGLVLALVFNATGYRFRIEREGGEVVQDGLTLTAVENYLKAGAA